MWPSFETITPEPSEFCTSASSFGLRNCRGLRLKKSNGSNAYCRRIAILREVFTLTTEGMTLLTSARRSRSKEASVGKGSSLFFDNQPSETLILHSFQVWIYFQDLHRSRPRPTHQRSISSKIAELERRQAALRCAEKIARTTQFPINFRDFETVG